MTDFLTTEHVLELHQQAHQCGDWSCVRDFGLIDSAVGRLRSPYYPDDWQRAAALLQSLSCNQAFVDGNKRTAWHCAWVFLTVNGHPLAETYDEVEAEAFVRGVENQSKVPDIAAGLKLYRQ